MNEIPDRLTMEFAQRDDCLERMVPSDLRLLLGRIAELEQELAAARRYISSYHADACVCHNCKPPQDKDQ